MAANPFIHIIEDDDEISSLLSTYLEKRSFDCVVSETAESAQEKGLEGFDLLVVDITLPGADGLSFCRWVRERSDIPVIILSALRGDTNRIKGLELGADDYLEKPFNPRELLVRMQALLRRRTDPPARRMTGRIAFEGWELDLAKQKLHAPGPLLVPLSSTEYRLLVLLTATAPEPVSREELGSRIFDVELGPEDRRVDILVSRLRKKLAQADGQADFIRTVRNRGYLFAADFRQLD